MDIEQFRAYCLSKKGVTEEFPFDKSTLVFKVSTKMFALSGLERLPFQVNLKCNPNRSIELREAYVEIQPGYHMNKKHWNTIIPSPSFPPSLFYELIDHSYQLVTDTLSKRQKEILNSL